MQKKIKPPKRIRIPFLFDLVVVSDPEQIKKISSSDAIDRLHAFPTASLPWWVRFFFGATKFHDKKRDIWFCPFESKSDATYEPRRKYLLDQVNKGYTQEDVETIADLLTRGADDEALGHAMVQVVNCRFVDEEIPLKITQDAKCTLQSLPEAFLPWKYRKAVTSREAILGYCEERLDPGISVIDVGHNIGEVVQSEVSALRSLQANLDMPVQQILTEVNAPTVQVPRIAVEASRFEGLLKRPIVPRKTVVMFKIAKAAAATQNLDFTFGTGGSERVCVFKEFFIEFMTDVQKKLKQAQ
jgi:hypothetical protein